MWQDQDKESPVDKNNQKEDHRQRRLEVEGHRKKNREMKRKKASGSKKQERQRPKRQTERGNNLESIE